MYSRYLSASARNGVRHIAAMTTAPSAPTAERSNPAPATSVPAASDIIPPTTGSAVDIAVLAALLVTTSAAPVTAPDRLRYTVNAVITTVVSSVHSHFISRAAPSRALLPRAADAVRTASSAYASGSSKLRLSVMNTSMNRLVAAYFAAAPAAEPPAAAVAARQGSSAWEKRLSSSMVSAPVFIHAEASPKATPATARQPAMLTYRREASVAKAEHADMSAATARSLTAPAAASPQRPRSRSPSADHSRENSPSGSSASLTPTSPRMS